MKKLFLGCIVALFALTFSAFTTKRTKLTTYYWAILADGNYHKLSSFDPDVNCVWSPTASSCAVLWTSTSQPNTNVLPQAAMNTFVHDGLAEYFSDPLYGDNTRYVP